MSDVVSVEFELTRDDWISAVESHARERGASRDQLRRLRLLFGIVLAALVLMLLWEGSTTAAALFAVLGAGWVAATPILARRTRRRQLRRIATEGVGHGTFGRHRVALTDEGILDSTDGYDWLIHWSAVERVEERGGSLLVYNGSHSFLTIPLAAFPDRASFEAFSSRFFRGLEARGHLGVEPGPGDEGDGFPTA